MVYVYLLFVHHNVEYTRNLKWRDGTTDIVSLKLRAINSFPKK